MIDKIELEGLEAAPHGYGNDPMQYLYHGILQYEHAIATGIDNLSTNIFASFDYLLIESGIKSSNVSGNISTSIRAKVSGEINFTLAQYFVYNTNNTPPPINNLEDVVKTDFNADIGINI